MILFQLHHLPISFWSYFQNTYLCDSPNYNCRKTNLDIFSCQFHFYQAVQSIRQYFYPSVNPLLPNLHFHGTSHLYHQHIFNMWCVLSIYRIFSIFVFYIFYQIAIICGFFSIHFMHSSSPMFFHPAPYSSASL